MHNGEYYTLNNRTYTVATYTDMDNIPVQWATWEEIWGYSYQFDNPNFGRTVYLRPDDLPWNGGFSR